SARRWMCRLGTAMPSVPSRSAPMKTVPELSRSMFGNASPDGVLSSRKWGFPRLWNSPFGSLWKLVTSSDGRPPSRSSASTPIPGRSIPLSGHADRCRALQVSELLEELVGDAQGMLPVGRAVEVAVRLALGRVHVGVRTDLPRPFHELIPLAEQPVARPEKDQGRRCVPGQVQGGG